MAGIQPWLGVLPDDINADLGRHVLQPRVTPRRRFWLEFGVLPSCHSIQEDDAQQRRENGFPQFGRLPPEIRLLVWECALRQPRIVVITSRCEDYTPARSQCPGVPPPPPPAWTPPPAELPVLMLVCREAYETAKRFYERAFAWKVPHVLIDEEADDTAGRGYRTTSTRNPPRPGGPGCWFNFAHDAVLLKGDLEPVLEAASTSMVYFMPHADVVRVQQVACSAADLGVGELMASQLYARLFPIVDRFSQIKCLHIVSGTSDSRSHSGQRQSRLSATEASCMSVSAAGTMTMASSNVCQQVWDLWTNSRRAGDGDGDRRQLEHIPYAKTNGPQDTIRMVMVAEDQLYSMLKL